MEAPFLSMLPVEDVLIAEADVGTMRVVIGRDLGVGEGVAFGVESLLANMETAFKNAVRYR
jgi:hypothetical protein